MVNPCFLSVEFEIIALFILQIRLLLEMLIKKCGLDAVKAVMPEEHMKLLTNIRKVLLTPHLMTI